MVLQVKSDDPMPSGEFCNEYYLGWKWGAFYCTGDKPFCCGEPTYRQCCSDCSQSLVDPCPIFPWKLFLGVFSGILVFGLLTAFICVCCCNGSREYDGEDDLDETAALIENERHRRRRLRRRRGLWILLKLKAFPGAVVGRLVHRRRHGPSNSGEVEPVPPTPVPPMTALGQSYGIGIAPPPPLVQPMAQPLPAFAGTGGYNTAASANVYGYDYKSAGLIPPPYDPLLATWKEDGFPTAPPVSPFPGAPKRN